MARHQRLSFKPSWPYSLAAGSTQADALVGWWPGDPSRGLKLYDQSGRRNHGVINGATNPAGIWGIGKDGGRSALTLAAASSQYADCGAILSGTVTNITISCWCWKTAANKSCNFGWQDTLNKSLGVEWFTDGNIYWSTNTGSASNYVVTALNDTGPHLLTLVYNGSIATASQRITPYVDGLPATITTSNGATSIPAAYTINGTFKIGHDAVNTIYADGRQEDCRLYTRSFSAQEVRGLWNPATRWALRYQAGKTRVFRQSAPSIGGGASGGLSGMSGLSGLSGIF